MGASPNNSRVVVVDFNVDTQMLTYPAVWDEEEGWYRTPLVENENGMKSVWCSNIFPIVNEKQLKTKIRPQEIGQEESKSE